MQAQNYTPINHLIAPPVSKPREAEPFKTSSEPIEVHEVVEQDRVDESVSSHIEVKKEQVEIPDEVAAAGVVATGDSQFTTLKKLELPLSDDKIMTGLHASVTSSFRWLATLAMYILRQAHMNLKMIQGKAVRVRRS